MLHRLAASLLLRRSNTGPTDWRAVSPLDSDHGMDSRCGNDNTGSIIGDSGESVSDRTAGQHVSKRGTSVVKGVGVAHPS